MWLRVRRVVDRTVLCEDVEGLWMLGDETASGMTNPVADPVGERDPQLSVLGAARPGLTNRARSRSTQTPAASKPRCRCPPGALHDPDADRYIRRHPTAPIRRPGKRTVFAPIDGIGATEPVGREPLIAHTSTPAKAASEAVLATRSGTRRMALGARLARRSQRLRSEPARPGGDRRDHDGATEAPPLRQREPA